MHNFHSSLGPLPARPPRLIPPAPHSARAPFRPRLIPSAPFPPLLTLPAPHSPAPGSAAPHPAPPHSPASSSALASSRPRLISPRLVLRAPRSAATSVARALFRLRLTPPAPHSPPMLSSLSPPLSSPRFEDPESSTPRTPTSAAAPRCGFAARPLTTTVKQPPSAKASFRPAFACTHGADCSQAARSQGRPGARPRAPRLVLRHRGTSPRR